MTTVRWWKRWPGRRDQEFAAFEANQIRVLDMREDHGILTVDLAVPVQGSGEVNVTATYPDTFPFFRPVVRFLGDGPDVERHVHPFGGNLCLLGRRADAWWPSETLAEMLITQIPKILRTGEGSHSSAAPDDVIRSLEEVQAEPFSAYYTCFVPGAVLLDSAWQPHTVTRGRMEVALGLPSHDGQGVVVGTVVRILDAAGVLLHPTDIAPVWDQIRLQVPWVRLDGPLVVDSAEEMAQEVERLYPRVLQDAQAVDLPGADLRAQMVAVAFPEERSHRDSSSYGWLFIIRTRSRPTTRRSRRPQVPSASAQTVAVRAAYVGRADLAVRVPELGALGRKHAAVFGLGAVGSPIVEHLARAGVGTLSLIDPDWFDPATLPRHAATMEHAGWPKAAALAAVARRCNPYVNVLPHGLHLGGERSDSTAPNEFDVLDDVLQGVDLVIDATAGGTPALLLSLLAAERGVPFIAASATSGAWGGRVARVRPGISEGCYSCLIGVMDQEERADETIERFSPPARSYDGVQPAACGESTFTGAGFDLTEVAIFAARLAVATLSSGTPDAYPDFCDDVFVLALRAEDGTPVAPRWTSSPVPRFDGCTAHAQATV